MAETSSIKTSIQMTPSEMQMYLQEFCGIPVALRHEGKTAINCCPHCGHRHVHSHWETGHTNALCKDKDRNVTITINGRDFIPNYGCVIHEHKLVSDGDDVHFETAAFLPPDE